MNSTYPAFYDFLQTPDYADETGVSGITYLGYWSPGPIGGNQTAQARFLIKRVTVTGTITKTEYASGNREFDKVWDDRATYTYSLLK
jgi:hypothetical protein